LLGIPEQVTIRGGQPLDGSVHAPPSKSHTHRALIAASLSPEKSWIHNPSLCEDVQATVQAVEAYGAEVIFENGPLIVSGVDHIRLPNNVVDCRESGSTMRFVTPILAHAEGISVVTGEASLRRRPMQPLIDSLRQLGVECYSARKDGRPPLVLFGGTYKGGKVRIVGDISSQFISGLLFSGSIAGEPTSIEVTPVLESAPYVGMTIKVLKCHGIQIDANVDMTRFSIDGRQTPSSYDHVIEGDYSSAAFLLAAGAITGSEVGVFGLPTERSSQGDSEVVSLLRGMRADVHADGGTVRVRSSRLRGMKIDASDCPDLVPPLAVVACCAEGTTKIVNAQRLRMKESNRLKALSSELSKMGAKICDTDDGFEIVGRSLLKGATVNSHGDHRVAMSCAVAALAAKGETILDGAGCVAKSYPSFFDDLKTLGGDISGR